VIVYEVNLQVEREIAADYLRWLHAHMAQMRMLPGFVAAELYQEEGEDGAPQLRLSARYQLQDAAALARYLVQDAPRMRADGLARFGARFSAQRRVLRPLAPA
jgi:hypothetical protein